MDRNVLNFKDLSREYMFTATLSSASVITAQPVRLDYDIWLTVKKGSIRITSDVISVNIPESSFCVFSQGQIIEVLSVSTDFEAIVFTLSGKFQNDLGISELFSLRLRFTLSPVILLDNESMEALEDYHRMCRRIIGLQDNPRRWESIANLTKAFYYGGGYYFFRDAQRPEPEDSTFSKFLALVDKHATRQRDTGFYADRLCITPKYLSRLVKQKTGKTAKEMILGCVLLRARTMLLNTDLNVQQIADQLGFPSQSVFGKFFKNRTGLSPTECRNTTGR